jgi:DNA repair ATPase RecN
MRALWVFAVRMTVVTFLALCCAVVWHVDQAARELGPAAAEWRSAAVNANKRVSDTAQNANALLVQLGLASDEVRRAAIEQRRSLRRTDRQVAGLMASADQAVRDLDGTINGLNQSQAAIAGKTVEALDEIRPALESSERLMDTTTSAVQIVGNRLDDPHVSHLVGQADEAVTNANKSTAIVEAELEKWTAPVKRVRAVLGTLGGWTAQHLFDHLVP